MTFRGPAVETKAGESEGGTQRDAGRAPRFGEACRPLCDAGAIPVTRLFDRRFRHDLHERLALTFERLGDIRGQRGLDIGCGSGVYLAEALRRGARPLVGVDPAPGQLELARRRFGQLGQLDRTDLLAGYFPQIAPDGPFDFAIAMGVLDYVDEPLAFLRSLARIVRGHSIVSFPRRHWLLAPVRQIRRLYRGTHVHYYNEPGIRSLARDAGFRSASIVAFDGLGMDYHVALDS
jgi:SAM-dependent methyltransferase